MRIVSKMAMVFMALSFAVTAGAQSATMLSMARAELQKRGLTESEVAERLQQKGIDVYSIQPSDYAKYQDQVMAAVAELEAEKSERDAGKTAATTNTVADVVPAPQTSTAERAAERQAKAAKTEAVPDTSNIYGHSFFTGNTLEVFRTTDGAQAPENYVLGPGDEVHISIFGSSQMEMQQRINSDGYIQPSGAGKIFLKGLTLKQARETLLSNLSAYYSFRRDQIAVTIITARTVLVNIFGEVRVSGGFSLSALNSAFNALAAAGGPTEIGSVRAIQVISGNQKNTLDLYAFMSNPDGKMKLDIQNNDIIYVPTAKNIVTVEGGVLRPMRYEMLDGESVKDLIGFAGGLQADADMNFLQVESLDNGEKRYTEYALRDVVSGAKTVPLKNGDIVRMRSISQPNDNYVAISGSVYYGGTYDLEANNSLLKLLENAKPTYAANTDILYVERTRDDKTCEVLTIPFPGVNGNPDFTLMKRDSVLVLDKSEFRDIKTISVNGQVRKPFTKDFSVADKMTVSQAIDYAGGLTESVFPVAYIYRRNIKNPAEMEYISIDLNKQGGFKLQPGDVLNVYDNSTYTNIGQISVAGAVKNPLNLTFDPKLTLKDVFTMAGGFENGVQLDRIEVFRVDYRTPTSTINKLILEVDEDYNVLNPEDFALNPYDKIVVRLKPEFNTGRSVQISGRVMYPGQYVIDNRQVTLTDIIEMAGGLLPDADPYGAQLFRSYRNRGYVSINLDEANSHKGSTVNNPIMMDEDVINISRRENVVAIYPLGTRMQQYVAEGYEYTDSVASTITNTTRKVIVYNGRHNARWYIQNYAGGFAKTADKNSVTVTYANNQMVGVKKFLGIRNYPIVEPGSTITLTLSHDKVIKEEEPKKKIDWNQTLATCLTTLTSAISMVAIISRL